jgi:hypothetical protein
VPVDGQCTTGLLTASPSVEPEANQSFELTIIAGIKLVY